MCAGTESGDKSLQSLPRNFLKYLRVLQGYTHGVSEVLSGRNLPASFASIRHDAACRGGRHMMQGHVQARVLFWTYTDNKHELGPPEFDRGQMHLMRRR